MFANLDLLADLLAAFCVGVGLAHLAAVVAILARYAIPRAPGYFHMILAPPMVLSAVAVSGVGLAVAGVPAFDPYSLQLSVVYVVSEFVIWWGLCGYSVYFAVKGRHIVSEGLTRLEESQGKDLQLSERMWTVMEGMANEQQAVRGELDEEQRKVRDALAVEQDRVRETLGGEQDRVRETLGDEQDKVRGAKEQDDAKHTEEAKERDEVQDARSLRQTERGSLQDERGERQDERERRQDERDEDERREES